MFWVLIKTVLLSICFGCSKELSHRDGSFEYPQHMFWLRNKKNNFLLHTLIWGPVFLFFILFEISDSAIFIINMESSCGEKKVWILDSWNRSRILKN